MHEIFFILNVTLWNWTGLSGFLGRESFCHTGNLSKKCALMAITIRIRIHQTLCSLSIWPPREKKNGGRRLCQISDCYVHRPIWQYGVFATVSVLRGTRWCPGVSKNKTLNSGNTSVVFFRALPKKVQVSGLCFGFCYPHIISYLPTVPNLAGQSRFFTMFPASRIAQKMSRILLLVPIFTKTKLYTVN